MVGESLDHTWRLMPTRAPDGAAPQRDPAGEEAGVLATSARLAANDSATSPTQRNPRKPWRQAREPSWLAVPCCPDKWTWGRACPSSQGRGTEATFRGPRTSSSGSLLSVVLVCTPFGCKASAFLSSPSHSRELLTLRELWEPQIYSWWSEVWVAWGLSSLQRGSEQGQPWGLCLPPEKWGSPRVAGPDPRQPRTASGL